MYAITNDHFDSFKAVFSAEECMLSGKNYPLGHFAVEALEMDGRLLRRLRNAIMGFKPELEVFLAARTASSAAVAQQKLDAVWTLLNQLPVYRELAGPCFGTPQLLSGMREHPDRRHQGDEFSPCAEPLAGQAGAPAGFCG